MLARLCTGAGLDLVELMIRVAAGENLSVDDRLSFTDKGQSQVGQRRQIPRGPHRTHSRYHRVHPRVKVPQEAIDDFTAAIQLAPKLAQAYNNRGYNRQMLDDYAAALADYNGAVVAIDPNTGGVLALVSPPEIEIEAGTPFEVLSAEEAPLLAARMLTAASPGQPLPPCRMRLATTLGTNALRFDDESLSVGTDGIRRVLAELGIAGAQHCNERVDHVGVELGAHAVDDLLDGAVVPEVDHLRPTALQQAPEDVDRRIVAVKQRCGGDDPDRINGFVYYCILSHAYSLNHTEMAVKKPGLGKNQIGGNIS